MNYINFFAKGGKATVGQMVQWIQQTLGITDMEMQELWQIGLNKYGSEEGIESALSDATKNITEQSSPEEIKAAVANVFSTDSKMFKCGGKLQQLTAKFGKGGDCGCNKVKTARPGDKIIKNGQKDAKKNAIKFPDLDRIKNRFVGMAVDENGGRHLFENAVIGGNSTDTRIYIPQPGDTIVNQSVQTRYGLDNRTYPQYSTGYESIMKRMRPLLNKVPVMQDGGTPDVTLKGRQMRDLAELDRDFNRGQANHAYWTAKKALKSNSDLRGKDLRNQARLMVSGIQETPQILSDTPQIRTKITGPKHYEEAIVTSENPIEIGAPIQKTVIKPIIKQEPVYGPAIKKNPKTDAWYQYQYERALYDNANHTYRPNQDSAAYQHWMWKDFNDAWDNNTNTVKRDFLMRSPSQEELLAFRDAGTFNHGILPWSKSDREAYGVDYNKRQFYFDDDSRYRADAQAHGIPATSDLYNGTARVMGTMLAPAFGEAAAQALNGIANLAADAYTGYNPTGVVMKRPGVLKNQGRAANGRFITKPQGSWYTDIYSGKRVPGYEVGALKNGGGGKVEKAQDGTLLSLDEIPYTDPHISTDRGPIYMLSRNDYGTDTLFVDKSKSPEELTKILFTPKGASHQTVVPRKWFGVKNINKYVDIDEARNFIKKQFDKAEQDKINRLYDAFRNLK